MPNIQTPSFFPILSLLPQRALCYVKETHREKLVAVFLDIYHAMWEGGEDVSKPEVLVKVLQQRFKEDEAQKIMASANNAPYKQRLNENTKEALNRGAFGCPWFFVQNSKGEEEPFFGSDRYVLCAQSSHALLAMLCLSLDPGRGSWMSMGTSAFSEQRAAERGYRYAFEAGICEP